MCLFSSFLVQEPESDDAVHETFISLFVSSASKDHPPNIVEFYAAALLPPSEQSPREHVQLFLELMPCEELLFVFNFETQFLFTVYATCASLIPHPCVVYAGVS